MGCIKGPKNVQNQEKWYKEIEEMYLYSRIIMNEKDTNLLFLALRRLFYLAVKSSNTTINGLDLQIKKNRKQSSENFSVIETGGGIEMDEQSITGLHLLEDE